MEIWTEKYRPRVLGEVVGQDEIVSRLKAFVKNRNMPHLLFAGPAGTGKTTCAICIAAELLGEHWNTNFTELNASDERGINTVRTKVKDFARTKSIGDVPFKIILLDEADALTREAQQALRRTMEKYTHTCRFILDCNYSSKIIGPIQSRATIFRFKPLKEKDMLQYLRRIAKSEKIDFDSAALKAIYAVSEGDCRQAVNLLQSAAASGKVTSDAIYKVASMARPSEILEIVKTAVNGDIISARSKIVDIMLEYGLSAIDTIKQVQKSVWDLKIPDSAKVYLLDKIAEYEFRVVEGSDPYLQIEAMLAQFYKVGDGKKP